MRSLSRRRLLTLAAAAAGLAAATPAASAGAAELGFTPAASIAPRAAHPDNVAVNARGDAAVVLSKGDELLLARRRAGKDWGTAQHLGTADPLLPRVAVAPDGTTFVAWADVDGPGRLHAAAVRAGAPLPTRSQIVAHRRGRAAGAGFHAQLVALPDGRAVLAYADRGRVSLSVGTRAGRFGPSVSVGAGVAETLVPDGSGGVVLTIVPKYGDDDGTVVRKLVLARWRPGQKALSHVSTLAPKAAGRAALVNAGRRVAVAWTDRTAVHVRQIAPAATRRLDVALDAPGLRAYGTSMALAADGRVAVASLQFPATGPSEQLSVASGRLGSALQAATLTAADATIERRLPCLAFARDGALVALTSTEPLGDGGVGQSLTAAGAVRPAGASAFGPLVPLTPDTPGAEDDSEMQNVFGCASTGGALAGVAQSITGGYGGTTGTAVFAISRDPS